ncbi:hypothetical protein M422DRAFT_157179 [Sphaerobolus stellatus SS14]|nr:hypothetical protein M422DRAFT_157179 [Sphaerobolus stellatus SS14]
MLPLCIGMPVMIKKNIATELCMTNGAEGHVLGWQSLMIKMNNREYPVLDIVYILLKDTAFSIKIPGLPENVVPITRTSRPITCEFPNGHSQRINRDQVDIILNFAMTDYASQGRTRPINVVDLNDCRTHFSYYTCFSRSSSVDNTVIVSGFNPNIIQGGITGWLRQEFRELESLNEITTLREEGILHPTVTGDRRITIVSNYHNLKGNSYITKNVHKALAYNDTREITEIMFDGTKWNKTLQEGILKSSDNKYRNSLQTEVHNSKKMKETIQVIAFPPYGTMKSIQNDIVPTANSIGFQWSNNSCALDALFTILRSIYISRGKGMFLPMFQLNPHMTKLVTGFQDLDTNICTPESLRDNVRDLLIENIGRRSFGYQLHGISLFELVSVMLDAGTPAIMYRWYCTNCDLIDNITYNNKAMIRLIDTHCRMENGIQTTSLQTALTNAMTYKDN